MLYCFIVVDTLLTVITSGIANSPAPLGHSTSDICLPRGPCHHLSRRIYESPVSVKCCNTTAY